MQATYPFCIISQRSGGTPVGSLNSSQCQQSFTIPQPPLRNILRLSLTCSSYLGIGGIQNPGDETAFLHICLPKPVTLTSTILTQTSTSCNSRPARKINFLDFLSQKDQDCLPHTEIALWQFITGKSRALSTLSLWTNLSKIPSLMP